MRRRCLLPPLKRIPAGEWFCPSCTSLRARPVPWAEELLGKQVRTWHARLNPKPSSSHSLSTLALNLTPPASSPSSLPSPSPSPSPSPYVDVYWDGDDKWYTAEVRRRKRQRVSRWDGKPMGSPAGPLVHELYYPADGELHWHDLAQVRPCHPCCPGRPCSFCGPCLPCSHLQPPRRSRHPRRSRRPRRSGRLIRRDRHTRRLLRRTTPTATFGDPAAGSPSSRVTRGRSVARYCRR